jgi:hypothetical protein
MGSKVITIETVINRSPEVVASDIDGEVVMMSIEKGQYYGLDLIASRIWELLGTRIKVADLIGILTEEYEVTRDACERDLLPLLNDLLAEKLVVIVS